MQIMNHLNDMQHMREAGVLPPAFSGFGLGRRDAASAAGMAKINHPCPASTQGNPGAVEEEGTICRVSGVENRMRPRNGGRIPFG
jgi:hypothetical protein